MEVCAAAGAEGQHVSRVYRHLPALDASLGAFAIRCIDDADIQTVRQWRNAQMDVLRQVSEIGADQQTAYFADAIWPQMDARRPGTILVTILRDGEPAGYGGLVHCEWDHRRAEISVLFAPEIAKDEPEYRRALLAFLTMIGEVGLARLGFNRLTLETYDIRPFHIGVLEEAGFTREGRLRGHVVIDGEPVDSLIHARLASD